MITAATGVALLPKAQFNSSEHNLETVNTVLYHDYNYP